MKLCFINQINDTTETALAENLHKRGHEVVFICNPKDPAYNYLNKIGLKTIKLEVRNRFDFKAIKFLKAFFNENKFDVFYIPTGRILSAATLAGVYKNAPVATYRGTLTTLSRFNPGDRLGYLNSRVSSIICNSNSVKERLKQFGVSDEKLQVIYKGHDISWYDTKPTEEFNKLKIKDRYIIGCVANFRPMKGGAFLLEALNSLKEEIPFHLILIGKITDKKILEKIEQYNLKDRVTIVGFRKDAKEWMKHFDLSIMPSLKKESFSRAIVESMSQSVPVLVSDVGGMTELVNDGQNGYVFKAGDLKNCMEKIRLCYSNMGENIGENAYNSIKTNYSIEKYVDNMQSLFSKISNKS